MGTTQTGNDGGGCVQSGHPYGLHRVLEPAGAMPQPAWKLDNRPICYDNEILIDVEMLNIDSASFTQIRQEAGGDVGKVADIMLRIVAERGKHHNPVTGSGGMLVGRVAQVGERIANRGDVQVGDRIATLVSLSLTPLWIEKIHHIDLKNGQVDATAKAILFETGIYAKMPDDLPDKVALAVFDVCGAPAQTARLVAPGQSVAILGAGGKSGLTVLRQARLSSETGTIVAIECGTSTCNRVKELGWADTVLNLDATKPVEVMESVRQVLGDQMADVVINCVNVPGTELSSILCARDRGTVYFFSMATSFTAAALGAEGVGKDVNMVIGNGYCHGHAEHAMDLVRNTPELLHLFSEKFANA